MNPFR
ncbi:hypothetical protein E2320_011855, partial [Naja naja]